MLKDRYKFKGDYANTSFMCAHLKAVQERAVIEPHVRKEGKSIELLLCATLKPLARRLDAALYDFKSQVSFTVKKEEALAVHAAYKYGWLPFNIVSQDIFQTIDKVI